jgi:hypothetical protein
VAFTPCLCSQRLPYFGVVGKHRWLESRMQETRSWVVGPLRARDSWLRCTPYGTQPLHPTRHCIVLHAADLAISHAPLAARMQKIFQHPKYVAGSRNRAYDVALLQLNRPVINVAFSKLAPPNLVSRQMRGGRCWYRSDSKWCRALAPWQPPLHAF